MTLRKGEKSNLSAFTFIHFWDCFSSGECCRGSSHRKTRSTLRSSTTSNSSAASTDIDVFQNQYIDTANFTSDK